MGTKESRFDSFFYNQALFGRNLWPAFLVGVAGLIWAFQPVATYYALEFEVRRNIQNAVATDWMIHFIIPVFLWIYFWVSFAVLAHGFGARMRVGRLFKLTGWGLAPFALVGLVRAAGKYYAFQGETIPVGVTMGRFESEWNGYQALLAELVGDPLLLGATAVSCIFLFLSAYIWVYVVKYSTDMEDRRKIYAVVAVPTLLYAGYSLFPHVM